MARTTSTVTRWFSCEALGAAGFAASFVLCSACAPSQSFRPPRSPDSSLEDELGLAVSSVRPRPYVTESTRVVAQGWWTTRLGSAWEFSTIVAFDASAAALGTALRWDYLKLPRVTSSIEAEAGFGWAALALPAAFWVTPELGVYCAPRLGNWGPLLTPFVPCGASIEVWKDMTLRAEVQLSWADFQTYNRRVHWGLGAAHAW